MEHIKQYINENKERFINELIELLKIPSISADPNYKKDVLSGDFPSQNNYVSIDKKLLEKL